MRDGREPIDGYAETSGPFPAQFGAFTLTAETARIGVDARYTFKPGTWVWGTAAWAHRLDGGKVPTSPALSSACTR